MSNIREMAKGDIDEVVRIIRLHDPYDAKYAERYFAEYFSDSQRTKSDDERNFVAVEERIVGVSGFTPCPYGTPNIYWLNWTCVHPDFRKHGIGSLLLRYVIKQVCTREARKLYVGTSNDYIYKPAMKLYQHFGFRVEGRLKNYYNHGEDCLILGKELEVEVMSDTIDPLFYSSDLTRKFLWLFPSVKDNRR